MGILPTASIASEPLSDFLFLVGKAGVPDAAGKGPYGGKEPSMGIGWLLCWMGLYLTPSKRNAIVKISAAFFVTGMALAMMRIDTPFIDFILGE